MKKSLYRFAFLACPYSHPSGNMRQDRFIIACEAAAWLRRRRRITVYSPIAHTHWIALNGRLDPMAKFWYRDALVMLRHASELWVLLLDDWQESKAVKGEFAQAVALGLPIHYIRYENGEFREVEKP